MNQIGTANKADFDMKTSKQSVTLQNLFCPNDLMISLVKQCTSKYPQLEPHPVYKRVIKKKKSEQME